MGKAGFIAGLIRGIFSMQHIEQEEDDQELQQQ
jgi:hypothetical protein